jgi:hypothetical protein
VPLELPALRVRLALRVLPVLRARLEPKDLKVFGVIPAQPDSRVLRVFRV